MGLIIRKSRSNLFVSESKKKKDLVLKVAPDEAFPTTRLSLFVCPFVAVVVPLVRWWIPFATRDMPPDGTFFWIFLQKEDRVKPVSLNILEKG